MMNIEDDFEFYCYLKKGLPGDFQIFAQPSTAYFSEWFYEYNVYRNGILFRQYQGDFRYIRKGELVSAARQLMKEILIVTNR